METPYEYEQEWQKELRQMYIDQVYGHIRYKYPVRRIFCGGCGRSFSQGLLPKSIVATTACDSVR